MSSHVQKARRHPAGAALMRALAFCLAWLLLSGLAAAITS